MRISIDQVQEPPHALSREDVKALLAVVPTEWLRHIKTVYLGATLPAQCRFARPVIYSAASSRLNIYSRGLQPDKARQEVLRELAVRGLGITTRYGHNLSAQELKRIDASIAPLLDKLRAKAAQKTDPEPLL